MFWKLIIKYTTPFILLISNQLIYIAIDYSISLREYKFLNILQGNIFAATFILILLNTLFIPSLAIIGDNSLFFLISSKKFNINHFKNIFNEKNANFFILFILQNATFSFIYSILRLNDLYNCNLSPSFANFRRENIKNQIWRREKRDLFEIGYYYAVMIILLTIIMVYSMTVPLIHLAGMFFLV